jgi:hypothetical protein
VKVCLLRVSLIYGEISLNSNYWKPVEKQSTFGVMYDFNPGNWPVNLMAGFSASNDSASGMAYIPNYGTRYFTAEGKTTELSIGARKYLMDTGPFRPYLSVGLSSISAELSVTALGVSVSDNSSSIGYFGNGGIMLLIKRFSVGLDLKILTGTSVVRLTLLYIWLF